MQEVNGEGVIGDYPVLEAGTPSSVAACSCCRQHQQAVVCCPCQIGMGMHASSWRYGQQLRQGCISVSCLGELD